MGKREETEMRDERGEMERGASGEIERENMKKGEERKKEKREKGEAMSGEKRAWGRKERGDI